MQEATLKLIESLKESVEKSTDHELLATTAALVAMMERQYFVNRALKDGAA